MKLKKRILVAPLNWGLGHATRCMPIIDSLLAHDFEPVIASDGESLQLLRKEYPKLNSVALPSYNVIYPKNGQRFRWKLLINSPNFLIAIKAERKQVASLIKTEEINGIISDNRFGVYNKAVPSVFITHQLQVLSGKTTWLSSKIHQHFIKSFDECWVPDNRNHPHLSGKLGHLDSFSIPIKYLGIISRFNKHSSEKKYDLLVLLSGPEPQRTLLEEQLLDQLKDFEGKVLFVKGKIESTQTRGVKYNITIVNYMKHLELEKAINESDLILSRSGYTTILDVAKLNKKAFFIPTSGQLEQEYLAKRLDEMGIVPYCAQDEFTVKHLKNVTLFKGFENFKTSSNIGNLLSLFKGK